jgi:predicted ATPase
MKPQPTRYLTRIRIERLFGRYSYDLQLKHWEALDDPRSRLAILYGDNGSGKTTLLRLAFHLLSPADNRGHKSFLAQVPFKRLELTLGADLIIGAERPGDKLLGNTTFFIKRSNGKGYRVDAKVNEENVFRQKKVLDPFLKRLSALDIALFFITDERDLQSDTIQSQATDDLKMIVRTQADPRRGPLIRYEDVIVKHKPKPTSRIDAALTTAMGYALNWAKEQVLSGSQQGEADANTIYTQIVRRLTDIGPHIPETPTQDVAGLVSTLREQGARSADFAKYGLPFASNIGQLIDALSNTKHNAPAIVTIVQPYVEGVKARLDALQQVQKSIDAFVATVNAFLVDKHVVFDLRHSITVIDPSGASLPSNVLSSGEKQLLLLFCNTLIARDNTTIFFIDEPELSLNVKWQRRLIDSLAETAGSRRVQFVLATHSFELLAPHSEHVWQLTPSLDVATSRKTKT